MNKSPADKFVAARHSMVELQLRSRGIADQCILEAFESIPREIFIPPELSDQAYGDYPVSIGFAQTISQPYVVALMLELLECKPNDRVLDVGSGSGYQTALLAKLVKEVFAIERIVPLTETASKALEKLGITNVKIQTGDGSLGLPDQAPFDKIICGASAPKVPDPWVDQLTDDGRIVIPVGSRISQMLVVVEKHET